MSGDGDRKIEDRDSPIFFCAKPLDALASAHENFVCLTPARTQSSTPDSRPHAREYNSYPFWEECLGNKIRPCLNSRPRCSPTFCIKNCRISRGSRVGIVKIETASFPKIAQLSEICFFFADRFKESIASDLRDDLQQCLTYTVVYRYLHTP